MEGGRGWARARVESDMLPTLPLFLSASSLRKAGKAAGTLLCVFCIERASAA